MTESHMTVKSTVECSRCGDERIYMDATRPEVMEALDKEGWFAVGFSEIASARKVGPSYWLCNRCAVAVEFFVRGEASTPESSSSLSFLSSEN